MRAVSCPPGGAVASPCRGCPSKARTPMRRVPPAGAFVGFGRRRYLAPGAAQRAGPGAPWGHRPQGKDLPTAAHVAASAGALAGVWRRAAQCGFAKYPFSGPNVCGGGPKNCPQGKEGNFAKRVFSGETKSHIYLTCGGPSATPGQVRRRGGGPPAVGFVIRKSPQAARPGGGYTVYGYRRSRGRLAGKSAPPPQQMRRASGGRPVPGL